MITKDLNHFESKYTFFIETIRKSEDILNENQLKNDTDAQVNGLNTFLNDATDKLETLKFQKKTSEVLYKEKVKENVEMIQVNNELSKEILTQEGITEDLNFKILELKGDLKLKSTELKNLNKNH